MPAGILSRLFSRNGSASTTSESCFSTVFHNAPILFAISTIPDGRYIEVNDTFLSTLGFSRHEVMGNTSFKMDLWHNPEDRSRLVSHLREHGSFQNEEIIIRKKNGDCFTGLFSGIILDIDGEQLLFTLATDISQRKDAEENLLRAKLLLENTVNEQAQVILAEMKEQQRVREDLKVARQMLIERNRQSMMGQMINNIIHQWRQPLNNLGLLIQNVSFEQGEDGQKSQMYLDKAMHLILYMAETAEVFRSFLKPVLEKSEFSLNDAIGRTILLFDTMHSGENIGVDYVKPGERIATVGNSNEFCQAILNVLNNARDALLERNVPDPRIIVEIEKCEGQWVVVVSDNGGGIAEEAFGSLFDVYFTTKPSDEGTGIGLCITRTIIEDRMGGKVSFCNRGSGAEFRLAVPCI
ncbi:ATP-binding protein [Geobacter sp. DSM 9736]|uniref:PAS domain-containing sensor histidine kinase n=1 Tax=Geobacter sp. DSM 9736 TaxID=1277350 RepID=UPI000B505C66|nr:ATP-binding protein [Geobacter sp. DSM 9736]SNB45876.1 PAS domain S-box-containing protein [Geobacter sp. DSM 9736]